MFIRTSKGFTLIEIAIVLVILGLLLASGIGIISILVKNKKFNETKDIINKACKTIEGYAISHKKLPNSLNSLGIPTKDSYTNDLVYAFASNMDTFDFCHNEPSGWLVLDDNGTTKNIAFIVYSKGANLHDETKTTSGSDYQIKPYGTDVNGYKYDDIVCYGDINLLREKGCEPFEIITDSLPEGTQYLSYPVVNFKISGGNLSNCSKTGNLPNGITLDSPTCSISGTPTEAGTFNFTITITDTIGRTTSKSFNLTVNPNPVKITTPYLPYGYKDQSYNVGLTAKGGTGSYTWTISGTLPNGLSVSDNTISGTPTETGTFDITVKACSSVTSSTSVCDSKTYTLSILDVSAGSGSGGGGGGSGGGGGGSSNYFHILVKDKVGYKINSGACIKIDEDSALSIDLNSYDINNDSLTFYKDDNCGGKDKCIYTLQDIINIDNNSNNIIKLEKIDKNNCTFQDL